MCHELCTQVSLSFRAVLKSLCHICYGFFAREKRSAQEHESTVLLSRRQLLDDKSSWQSCDHHNIRQSVFADFYSPILFKRSCITSVLKVLLYYKYTSVRHTLLQTLEKYVLELQELKRNQEKTKRGILIHHDWHVIHLVTFSLQCSSFCCWSLTSSNSA